MTTTTCLLRIFVANLCFCYLSRRNLVGRFFFLALRRNFFQFRGILPAHKDLYLGLGGEVIIADFERTDCKIVFNHSLTFCFECLISFIAWARALSQPLHCRVVGSLPPNFRCFWFDMSIRVHSTSVCFDFTVLNSSTNQFLYKFLGFQ